MTRITQAAALSLMVLLSTLSLSSHTAAAQPSPLGTTDEDLYGSPFAGPVTSWTASDEAWYRRNRHFALAGKLLTVAGIVTSLGIGVPTDSFGTVLTGLAVQYAGQLIWSGSELRGAHGLRARGVKVTRAPAIVSLCGALLLSPLTWIAGPVQSARIRAAHERSTGLARLPKAPAPRYGLGLRLRF